MNQSHHPTQPGRLEVRLSGPLAAVVRALLDERFDGVSILGGSGSDVIMVFGDLDQAGERAVLNMLWDTGHQVRSVSRIDP